jgi:two-component system, sensor histidine kinase YesM
MLKHQVKTLWNLNIGRNISIQFKIFTAFIIVTLTSILIVTLGIKAFSQNIIKELVSENSAGSIVRANDNLEITLRDIDDISAAIAVNKPYVINTLLKKSGDSDNAWLQEQKKLINFLESIYIYKPYIEGITVYGTDGSRYSAGVSYNQDISADSDFTRSVLKAEGKILFLRQSFKYYNVIHNDKNIDVITASRSINYNGRPIGMIVVFLKYDVIKKSLDIGEVTKGDVFTIDAQNKLIYKSDSITEERISNFYLNNLELDRRTRETNIRKIEGKNFILSAYTSSFTGWTSLVAIPEEIFMEKLRYYNRVVMLWLIPIIILVLVVSTILSKRITGNLEKLSNSMREVGRGNLNAVPLIEDRDEIGQLSQIFGAMTRDIQRLMEDVRNTESKRRDAELKALQSQINPHFLYNTLNTIKYMASLQRANNIEDVSASLIDLLRITVGTNDKLIPIEMEVEHVKKYINIQKYKYIDKFDTVIEVEEGVLKYKTLKLMLQPLIENAIFHGIEPSEGKGIISIKIYKENEEVIKFRIADNGVGMDDNTIAKIMKWDNKESKGKFINIGLHNINERIKLFFGSGYGIKIDSKPGMYTIVEITIPVIEGDDWDFV